MHGQILGIIPARYASTRFPGKPLADLGGKSMIQRVCEQVKASRLIDEIVVATDDDRIFKHVEALGHPVMMTADTHRSGTDRCAEVAQKLPQFKVVINIQGDEPFIDPAQIDKVAQPLTQSTGPAITTLAKQLTDQASVFNPNVVKVVFDRHKRALYFSRSPIPYLRGIPEEDWLKKGQFFKHLGIYGFQREALLRVAQLAPGRLEQYESLEQLRWLEQGLPIFVDITAHESIGIDTPEDLERARAFFTSE
jgi:3-deoxy-manno-octulosonate cytidylyltransferase (CMP-KDO synthetase)